VQGSEHDPAEDAAAALRLYVRYWMPVEKYGQDVVNVPTRRTHGTTQQNKDSRNGMNDGKQPPPVLDFGKENWPNLRRPLPVDKRHV
jgi:hypothetical protein